jgi:hypothetical protein
MILVNVLARGIEGSIPLGAGLHSPSASQRAGLHSPSASQRAGLHTVCSHIAAQPAESNITVQPVGLVGHTAYTT